MCKGKLEFFERSLLYKIVPFLFCLSMCLCVTVHLNEQEVEKRGQEICMDGQGAPGKTQTNRRKKRTEGGSRDRSLGRNIGTLSEYARMGLRRPFGV